MDAGFEPVYAEVGMVPQTTVELDVETARKVLKLIVVLEDLDDSQNIYHNAEIPEEVMDEVSFTLFMVFWCIGR